MKKLKSVKSLLCAFFAVLCLSLSGCGFVSSNRSGGYEAADKARIDVYESQDEDNWYFIIDVTVNKNLELYLNNKAANISASDKKWTLSQWLCDYFEVASDVTGFSYRYDDVTTVNDGKGNTDYVYGFTVNVAKDTENAELSEGLTLDAKYDDKTNLFIRTVNVVREDRFNFWAAEYKSAYGRYRAGTPEYNDYRSLMGMILFGHRTAEADETEVLPGFFKAFPAAKPEDYASLTLANHWYASKHVNTDYDDLEYIDGDSNVFYVFQKKLGDGDTTVEYEYYRADPTGWYIVAILAGGAAVGISYLIWYILKRRNDSQPPPQIKDMFPYDPFADDDGGNGGSIDPFA